MLNSLRHIDFFFHSTYITCTRLINLPFSRETALRRKVETKNKKYLLKKMTKKVTSLLCASIVTRSEIS